MTMFVKPMMWTVLGLGCLTLGATARQTPPTPPAPPAPTVYSTQPVSGISTRPAVVAPVPNTTVPGVYVQGVTDYRFAPAQTGSLSLMSTEGFDLEARKLAKQIADAKSDSDKEKSRDKLKEHLDKLFEDRQKRHEADVEALEAQIKKLKDMISKRKENKRDIIDERMKHLVRDAQGLGW